MTSRPCPLCEHPKSKQYCAPCLREGVANHSDVMDKIRAASSKAVAHAQHLLDGPITSAQNTAPVKGATAWRELRASVAAAERRVADLRAQVTARKREIKEARDTVARSSVRARDESLETARRARLNAEDLRAQISLVKQQQREVGKRIIQARRVLVREVVDVFGVQAVQRGPEPVWQIAGIDLPEPQNFRRRLQRVTELIPGYPSVTINGAFVHTIHLLSLVTHYLSVALPFNPTYVSPTGGPGTFHIGRPQMRANLPFLVTTKWRDKHVLWMSSTASLSNKLRKGEGERSTILDTVERSYKKHLATLEAFALLAHSTAYLAYTQGVPGIGLRENVLSRDSDDDDDDPLPPDTSGVLVSPTSVLELISLTAESSTLGCRAHEPGTSDTISHMSFGLDVKNVVRTVLRAEKAAWGGRTGDGGEELSEGWDLMENE